MGGPAAVCCGPQGVSPVTSACGEPEPHRPGVSCHTAGPVEPCPISPAQTILTSPLLDAAPQWLLCHASVHPALAPPCRTANVWLTGRTPCCSSLAPHAPWKRSCSLGPIPLGCSSCHKPKEHLPALPHFPVLCRSIASASPTARASGCASMARRRAAGASRQVQAAPGSACLHVSNEWGSVGPVSHNTLSNQVPKPHSVPGRP